MTAKIETPEETYHIEPSWRHLDPSDDQSMIAYRESDVILSWTNNDNQNKDEDMVHQPKICDYIRENGTAVGMEDDEDSNHQNEFLGDGEWQPGEISG